MRWRDRVIPELADYMAGLRVVAHLRETGLELAPDQAMITALGRAQREAGPGPAPEMPPDLVAVLDQIQARNRRERELMTMGMDLGMGMDQAGRSPDAAQPDRPTDPKGSDAPAMAKGGTDPASGADTEGPVPIEGNVTDEVSWYLKHVPDPDDEEWTEHDR